MQVGHNIENDLNEKGLETIGWNNLARDGDK